MESTGDDGTYNDHKHAGGVLPPCEETSHDQNDDCDGDSCNGKVEFDIGTIHYDHNKLDRKSEEKEKVEFEERDVDLAIREPRRDPRHIAYSLGMSDSASSSSDLR